MESRSFTGLDIRLTICDQECSHCRWYEQFTGADPTHNAPGLAGDLDVVKQHFPPSWPG